MTKYLVLYRSDVTAGEAIGASPEDAEAGMAAWMTWMQKAGNAIVDFGSPVNRVATVGSGATGQAIGGFSILEAESKEAVEALLDGHPHLSAPGGPSIEILQFLQIPGM